MVPIIINWKDIKENFPATLANYILKNGIGQKTASPENHAMYQWAKGFIPNLRTAMFHVEETYGVIP
jgi:hypothetical protein